MDSGYTNKVFLFQILKLMCLNEAVCHRLLFPTPQCQTVRWCQSLPTNYTPFNCTECNKCIITCSSKQRNCQLRLFIGALTECRLVDKKLPQDSKTRPEMRTRFISIAVQIFSHPTAECDLGYISSSHQVPFPPSILSWLRC